MARGVRLWIGPAVGIVVLAGLVVAVRTVKPSGPPSGAGSSSSASSTASGPTVVNINPDDVTRVVMTVGDKSLTLVVVPSKSKSKTPPLEPDWRIGSPTGAKADANTVTSLLFALDPLTSQRTVDIQPKDAGLSPPAKTLAVTQTDGATTTIAVGSQAPIGGTYAEVQGKPTIYLIGGSLAGQITTTPSAWLTPPASSSTAAP